jgi:2'-hydroxyisoflavone reductase
MFPDLEKLKGDRDNQLEALEGRKWDAVVDTSGYVPRHVKLSAELLAPNTEHYVFVSSISVYADEGNPMPEDHPTAVLKEPGTETVDNETYGPLKALCELAAESAMPGRVSNIRPGLIVGPRDNSGRFTYWPWRVAQGGEILSPGDPDTEIEFIDARDLAAFMMHCVDNKLGGVFNANGPGVAFSMQELLHGCKVVLGSNARFTWIPDELLLEMGAQPWMELPLWIPASIPNGSTVIDKALQAGLSHRPAGDTIRDTHLWLQTALDNPRTLGRSLKPEKETELLAKWHSRSNQD